MSEVRLYPEGYVRVALLLLPGTPFLFVHYGRGRQTECHLVKREMTFKKGHFPEGHVCVAEKKRGGRQALRERALFSQGHRSFAHYGRIRFHAKPKV